MREEWCWGRYGVFRRHRNRPVVWAAGVETKGSPDGTEAKLPISDEKEMMSAESDDADRRWAAQGRRKWRRQVDQTRTASAVRGTTTFNQFIEVFGAGMCPTVLGIRIEVPHEQSVRALPVLEF